LVGVGFLMLLFTALQGWGMVALIVFPGEMQTALVADGKRLHNLGLSGGFLAIAFGLSLIVLPLDERRTKLICKLLLPSLLIAPVAFSDRTLEILLGSMAPGLQACFYGLQAVSALGITMSLVLMVAWVLRG
jgi:hypothetical protein